MKHHIFDILFKVTLFLAANKYYSFYVFIAFLILLSFVMIKYKENYKVIILKKYFFYIILILLLFFFSYIYYLSLNDFVPTCSEKQEMEYRLYYNDSITEGWNLYYLPNCFINSKLYLKSTLKFIKDEKERVFHNVPKNKRLDIIVVQGILHFEKSYGDDWIDKDMSYIAENLITIGLSTDTVDRTKFSNIYIGGKFQRNGKIEIISRRIVHKIFPEEKIVLDYRNLNINVLSDFIFITNNDSKKFKYNRFQYYLTNRNNMREVEICYFDYGKRFNIYLY